MPTNQSLRKWIILTPTLLIIIVVCICLFWRWSTTVVLVTRHAERDDAGTCAPATIHGSRNVPISFVDGQSPRAQALASVCGDAGIAAIYVSEFCRTRQTVEPLATRLGVQPTTADQYLENLSVDVDNLVTRVLSENRGQVVLIVGHSNTIPPIIEGLSGVTVSPIGEGEFDNLFVVTIPRWFGHPKVVRLRYGAVSLPAP